MRCCEVSIRPFVVLSWRTLGRKDGYKTSIGEKPDFTTLSTMVPGIRYIDIPTKKMNT